jgi:hypothetical protein
MLDESAGEGDYGRERLRESLSRLLGWQEDIFLFVKLEKIICKIGKKYFFFFPQFSGGYFFFCV